MGDLLPDGFRFGVATAGYQAEGGFNLPGGPANNWARWERSGRAQRSGAAVGFWDRYEEHMGKAAELGCDAFRFSVEWARCEPEPGRYDRGALARYADMARTARRLGLQPLVTVHHFTHPDWLGEDFWLSDDAVEVYARWAATVVEHVGDHCLHWISVNEANVLAGQSYLSAAFPPGRRVDVSAAARSFDALMAAAVRGYEVIHAAQPDATVAINLLALSVYELDSAPQDILAARSLGVPRHGLAPWLAERRKAFYDTQPAAGPWEAALRGMAARAFPAKEAWPRLTDAVYGSAHELCVDADGFDFYSPSIADHARLPGRRTAGGRRWQLGQALWDDEPSPAGLRQRCGRGDVSGLPVWVVENGLCNRVRDGRSWPRTDGWTRPRYLRENLGAVVSAVDAGIPVTAYYHWTLIDNYEWGSYEPRFGLFGASYGSDNVWMDTDAMGDDAPGAYRRLIAGLRAGDRSVLDPLPAATG
ncbi:MAG TPA: family 1 glycosylhydrolase [Acidimicrobiales bacterium]|nr:family 1 glycosylhydrolase [Acidimicrobiales bacterium]